MDTKIIGHILQPWENPEVYYENGYGLFAVDSEAVTSGTIYSPYSGELCVELNK